jgi:hypothetical protein
MSKSEVGVREILAEEELSAVATAPARWLLDAGGGGV